MPETRPQYSDLEAGLGAVKRFYGSTDVLPANTIIPEIQALHERVSGMPGFLGCFGVGYPFYAMGSDEKLVSVPAISDFIEAGEHKINESRAQFGETWPCVDCHRDNQLPNLNTACRPCDRTLFKPRDLFESLPDIDVALVFEKPTEETEAAVEEQLNALGLSQSDNDIPGTYNNIMGVVTGADGKLPIDAHIWSAEAFDTSCQAIQSDPAQGKVPIISRSLHATWEDHTINFWFDFVFSLREFGKLNRRLERSVRSTRAALANTLGSAGILDVIPSVSRRGKAILADPDIYGIMKAKFEAWQN